MPWTATDRLAGAPDVAVTLQWCGVLRVKWEPNASDTRTAADPPAGQWTTLQLPRL
ncbi:MAG: hypothetical protein M3083_16090 [Actinomycetota bacterium]|nr:hypothetical protein [Actinomycetota bacterium]